MRRSGFLTAAAAALLSVFAVNAASANVITVAGGIGTITCTSSCEAYTGAGSPGEPTGPGTLSSTTASVYPGNPSNEASEATRLSTLSGLTFTSADADRTLGNGGSMSFQTLAEYFLLKLGNVAVYLKNTSGGLLTVDYAATAGAGAGLSHYTEFSEVPLPAAGWLMLAGLAGLGFSTRRRKTI
ncbi:MAG: VPLPA-CTERM sorting domain-containing protein [Amphiplicatus sp.]